MQLKQIISLSFIIVMMIYTKISSIEAGEPLMLMTADEDGDFSVHDEVLHQMFKSLPPEVLVRKLAVISVVGSSSRSKSLLWSSLLANLEKEKDVSSRNKFSWRDMDLEDQGLSVWSEPLLIGDDLAVILLQSHGMHEAESQFFTSLVFTLTAQISSLQIYVTSENFPTSHLPDLKHFTRFARAATRSLDQRLFQQLIIFATDSTAEHPLSQVIFAFRALVNWFRPYTYEYGVHAGQQLMKTWLKSYEAETLKDGYFMKPSCYLMPHPNIAGKVNNEFKSHFKNFIRDITINGLKPRSIGGKVMRVGDFPIFFKIFADSLVASQVTPKIALKRQVDESCLIAKEIFKSLHFKKFQSLIASTTSQNHLQSLYSQETKITLLSFDRYPVLSGGSGSDCSSQLKKEIDEEYHKIESMIKEAFSQDAEHRTSRTRGRHNVLEFRIELLGLCF